MHVQLQPESPEAPGELNSPPESLKKADSFGSPQQNLLRKTSCKADSFKSAYFHLTSHRTSRALMKKLRSRSTGSEVLKEKTLIDALRPVKPYAGLTSFTTYTFIHGESLLLAAQPLSHMQIESCDFPSGWRSGSSLFVWKLGGKPAFSWSESGFTSSWTPLEGNGIHVAFFWAKQTRIITSSQFSALFFLLLVNLLTSDLFPPEVELPAIHLHYSTNLLFHLNKIFSSTIWN